MRLKKLLTILIITGGTLIMKGGALLFGFKTFLDNIFTNHQDIIYIGSAVAFLSAVHVITFTRGAYLWKGIYSSNKLRSLEKEYGKEYSKQLHKVAILSGGIAIVSGIGLIPVLCYIGAREVLNFLHINSQIILYILFTYCLISDYIAYLSFTTRVTIENTKKFYWDLFLDKDSANRFPLYKTLVITSLGFISNMSFNYFLSRNAISVAINDRVAVSIISAVIAILSAIVTFLSKSGNVYTSLSNKDKQKCNNIKAFTQRDKLVLIYHKVIGFSYLLCFGFAYYISCMKNFVYFGININNIGARVPLELLAILISISATYMEYALSYKSMIVEFLKRVSTVPKIATQSNNIIKTIIHLK